MKTSRNNWIQENFPLDSTSKQAPRTGEEYNPKKHENDAIIENYSDAIKLSEVHLNNQFYTDNKLKSTDRKPPKYPCSKNSQKRKSRKKVSEKIRNQSGGPKDSLKAPVTENHRPGSCISISSLTFFDELVPTEDDLKSKPGSSLSFSSSASSFQRPASASFHSKSSINKLNSTVSTPKPGKLTSRPSSAGVSIPQSVRGYDSSKNISSPNCVKVKRVTDSQVTTITFGSELCKDTESWKIGANHFKPLQSASKKQESGKLEISQKQGWPKGITNRKRHKSSPPLGLKRASTSKR